MSDSGLIFSEYHRLRKYVDMLDEFLLAIQDEKKSKNSDLPIKVGNFLKSLCKRNEDMSIDIDLISKIIKNQGSPDLSGYSTLFPEIAEKLIKTMEIDENGLNKIEALSSLLDQESSRVYARMRGRSS